MSGSARRLMYGGILLTCMCIVILNLVFESKFLLSLSGEQQSKQGRKPKLGDGCHHVFLDVGANIGVHSRFLFEPEKYPAAKEAHSIFDKEFGVQRNNSEYCAFAFEPNPAHASRHKELGYAYNRLGWRYHYIQTAVSDTEGNITFYHNNDADKMEWGFGDHDLKKTKPGIPVTVPMVRLSTWLNDEILGRKLPESVNGTKSSPKVVMKMDIESLEFAVLPDLMFTGVLCKTIDFIFGELHGWDINYDADEKTGRGGLHTANGIPMMRESLKLFHSIKDCRTIFEELDDESYLTDGVPFPS